MKIRPPKFVEENIRVCESGVRADYLLTGLPYMFKTKSRRRAFAELHRQLGQALPSGTLLYGLAAPIDIRVIGRRALARHSHQDPWVEHLRAYEPTFTAYAPYQRLYWLSVPVDAGADGYTKGSTRLRVQNWIAGADSDAATTLEGWKSTAATMITALPTIEFRPVPVTAAQIEWFWNQFCSLGAFLDPFPGSAVRPAGVFEGADFYERGGRRGEAIMRVRRPDSPSIGDSYQSVATVFGAKALRFPGSEIFKLVDHLNPELGRVNWVQHIHLPHSQDEKDRNAGVARNIRDQTRQRGVAALNDDELRNQMIDLRDYNNLLTDEPGQKGMELEIAFVAGASTLAKARLLQQALSKIMDRSKVTVRSYCGAQTSMVKLFNPGDEKQAGMAGMSHPTTPTKWSRFVPLISGGLGNATGIPFMVNHTTLRREIVFIDLEGAPQRGHVPVLLVGGSPGGGKSHCTKLLVLAEMKRGARIHVCDPTDTREWQKALAKQPNTEVIDVAGGRVAMDLLRLLPGDEAGEVLADHLTPLLGFASESREADRLELLLNPASRDTNGIGSMRGLMRYLRSLEGANEDPILEKLEVLSTKSYMQSMFDESLPAPRIEKLSALIWNMAGLALPSALEHETAHLAARIPRRERAGQAIYGICAALSQHLFASAPDSHDVLVVEEAEAYANSPAGAKRLHKITRESRRLDWGLIVVSQNLVRDLRAVGTEFVTQTILTRFDDDDVAKDHLSKFMGITEDEYPDVVRRYIHDTSPPMLIDNVETATGAEGFEDEFDVAMADHGKTIPGREGECFFRDEFRRVGRGKLLAAPTAALSAALDTTPKPRDRKEGVA